MTKEIVTPEEIVAPKEIVTRGSANVAGRILDAAQAEFMAVGYERANTNRMAAENGISKATIFRHYRTKLDLFEAVVQRIAMRWSEGLELAQQADLAPEAWLRQFAQGALQWVLSEEALFVGRMAIAEGAVLKDAREVWPRFATRPIVEALTAQFKLWQDRGVMKIMPVEDLAVAFLDLMLAGKVTRAMYDHDASEPPEEIDRHVRFCVTLFLGGCAA